MLGRVLRRRDTNRRTINSHYCMKRMVAETSGKPTIAQPKPFKYISEAPHKIFKNVIVLTMNRPEIHNAFNAEMIKELLQIFSGITLENARAVVLTGEGKSFSAGADANWMKKMVDYTPEQNIEDAQYLFDMLKAIKHCQVPVIAKVNGSALGGGAGVVAAADIAFTVNNAVFGFTETKLGLIPATISPFVVEKIGASQSRRLFLTGERFNAMDGLRYGLVHGVYEDQTMLEEAIFQLLKEMSSSSVEAMSSCKNLIEGVKGRSTHDDNVRNFVCSEIARVRTSPYGQEGLSAFLEKRRPKW
eukprot:TRINITY_DN6012_c0_g1_i1.p1 TRINITY_DN6012_c0_g1~~TRINITY_DN6012_c0_g1_i1.p1  ORF type:complete len:302 (+),score=56.37 TRINITY_DN6012_c0_g1_i1:20-925(+)